MFDKKRRTMGREFLQSKTLGKSQRNKRQALKNQHNTIWRFNNKIYYKIYKVTRINMIKK